MRHNVVTYDRRKFTMKTTFALLIFLCTAAIGANAQTASMVIWGPQWVNQVLSDESAMLGSPAVESTVGDFCGELLMDLDTGAVAMAEVPSEECGAVQSEEKARKPASGGKLAKGKGRAK